MIYRVRLEGGAASTDQLEREFRGLASQIGQVAYLEGYAGREMLSPRTVSESKYGSDGEVTLGGSRWHFDWQGRHTFELKPYEGDHEALQPHDQPDYEVNWVQVPYEAVGIAHPGQVLPVAAGPPASDARREPQPYAIVLTRQNGDPGPRSGMAWQGASQLLADVATWPGVKEIRTEFIALEGRAIGDPPGRWRLTVVFKASAASLAREDLVLLHESLDEVAGLAYRDLLETSLPE